MNPTSDNDTQIKQQSLSFFLIEDEHKNEIESRLIKTANTKPAITINLRNSHARLFIKKQHESTPDWIKWLAKAPEIQEQEFGKGLSTGAAMLVYISDMVFALGFGYGYTLINKEMIVRDFGLRIALNTLAPGEILSLDKVMGEANPLHARTQSLKNADIADLLVDTEVDMLNAITGRVDKELIKYLGKKITGSDNLKISPNIEIDELPELLLTLLDIYTKPLPNEYRWVENVRKVRQSLIVGKLNQQLVENLEDPNEKQNILIGPPTIIDHSSEIKFGFTPKTENRWQFIQLDKLTDYIKRNKSLSFEALATATIYCFNENDEEIDHWKAIRCIHTQIILDKETYILRNGDWFKVAKTFVERINNAIREIQINKINLPIYQHMSEGEYNKEVANNQNMLCLDAKNINHGGGHSKIEFCDLFDDKNTMIHVKRYNGSATLSHLFSQGAIAGELFRSDADFRDKLNDNLPPEFQLKDTKALPDVNNYHLVFAIVTNKDLPEGLPFFSKITLKNTYRILTALGYTVSLTRIEVDPNHEKTLIKKGKKSPKQITAQ